jgi:hypothetical protein
LYWNGSYEGAWMFWQAQMCLHMWIWSVTCWETLFQKCQVRGAKQSLLDHFYAQVWIVRVRHHFSSLTVVSCPEGCF